MVRQHFYQLFAEIAAAIERHSSGENPILLQALRDSAEQIKTQFESTLEKKLLKESDSDNHSSEDEKGECVETTNWADETEKANNDLLKCFNFSEHEDVGMECVAMPQLVARQAIGTTENANAKKSEENISQNKTVSANLFNTSVMQLAIEKEKQAMELHNSQTTFLNAPGEFGLYALYMYNRAMKELEQIPRMPEWAQASDYRHLRDFITRFLTLIHDINIGVHYIEPILLGSVIAALNQNTLSVWSYAMWTERATLATMLTFLANQEEIADETWNFHANRAPIGHQSNRPPIDQPGVVNFGTSGSGAATSNRPPIDQSKNSNFGASGSGVSASKYESRKDNSVDRVNAKKRDTSTGSEWHNRKT